MTRDEMESRFLALRGTICAALVKAGAPGFTIKQPESDMPGDAARLLRLTRGDTGLGLVLTCNAYQDSGKVRVAVDTPTDAKRRAMWWGDIMPYNVEKGGREPTPEIKVSLDKPADQIARDVVRRLMPRLDAAWPIFQKRMAEVTESMGNRAAMLETLRGMGGRFTLREGDDSSTVHVAFSVGSRNLSVEVNEYGHLRIPYLSPDLPILRGILAGMAESGA